MKYNKPMHLAIATMLANPILSKEQVAQACGVSVQTVSKIAKQIQQSAEENKIELAAYKMLVREQMPAESRVEAISHVMKAKKNPFAMMRAVEYADSVLGLAPKVQQAQQEGDNTRPIFSMPVINVQVNIATKDV